MRIEAIAIGTNPPDDVNVLIEVPIDVLICNTRPLVPGCLIIVRPIGVLVMADNAGQDEKVIAVPSSHLTRRYDGVNEYTATGTSRDIVPAAPTTPARP